MNFAKSIVAVDTHTMGEPTRAVIGGIPFIPGNSMVEKKEYLQNNLDYLRTALLLEPRGHDDMFGAVITPPLDPSAHLGVVFMDTGGYLNMCGHGTIGVVTIAIEMGMIPAREPVTEVVLETPAGLVKTKATVSGNKVKDVTFQNVPAFVYKLGHKVLLPGIGEVSVNIAFGGSFFGIIAARDLQIELKLENIPDIIALGVNLRHVLNDSLKVSHPEKEHINTVDLIEIYDTPTHPDAHLKNCVVFGNGQVDRSPCGTGTCAKLAELYYKKRIKINEQFTNESILGTIFTGRVVEETRVGEYPAVVPEITGSAYITGIHQFMIDLEDPLKYGFSLK